MEITIEDAQKNLEGLIQSAHQGHDVFLTEKDQIVAQIIAITPLPNLPDGDTVSTERNPNKETPLLEKTEAASADKFLYNADGLPK